MTETDVNVDSLVDLIHDAGCPLHVNVLTRRALRSWLETKAQERHYAPGAHFELGERIRFQGQWATVTDVQAARNPVQGDFSVLTIAPPDGSEYLVAADVPGAPVEERQPVTQEAVDGLLDNRGDEARRTVRAALGDDPRLVSCSTPQGEIWCLQEMVPEVTREEVRSAEAILPDELVDGELVSCTTEELAEAIWGLEDDGGDDYALCAFALRRVLDDHEAVVNLGDRWAHARAWRTLRTERESLASPRQPCEVEIPQGIQKATASEVAQASARETVEEEEPEEETPEPQDLEAWRKDHPDHAIFTLRARHYYEGWLPLSKKVRRLFPPLGIGQQEVTFHHRFGDEPKSFPAYVDRDAGRILLSPTMYETFRSHRIYPGARLRLSVRNEQEFDLATRPTEKTEPIRVWQMWLNEDGEIEYDEFEEQPRYDIDDDVYVADVRFEDREALFRQAEETGASIYQLMYEKAVELWEENDRNSLVVTADELFDAIHRDEQGRMVSKATIGWELWKRLAFKPLGGGRYRFRPEFGAEVRLAVPSQRVEPPELVAPPEAPAYFIFQQHPDSEYADEAGEIYNWRKGIPGSRQIVEGARFIYYRPGEQVFFGAGRVASIDTYTGEDGETYYDGHIADYEPWDPPLPLTPELAQRVSFISPDRLGVGQAGIRKISRDDFVTIVRACCRGPRHEHAPKLVTEDRDELWDRVTQLEGQTLYTLSQRSPFKVARVTEGTLTIELEEGTRPTLARQKLEGAYAQLTAEGQISRSDIEAFLRFNSSYAAAVLASLPDVDFQTRPIRLFYESRKASLGAAAVEEAPPIGQEMPSGTAREGVKEILRSWRPLRPTKAVRSRSLFEVGDYLFWIRYSKFHQKQNQFWLGIPRQHYEVIKNRTKPIYVLLICGHPERTLVVPFDVLESMGITSAPVNKNGEWILYVYPSDDRFELAIWFGSGERERADVTRFLNNYPYEQVAPDRDAEQSPPDASAGAEGRPERTRSGQIVATDLVPPGPLFEKPPAEPGVYEAAEEPESRGDEPRDPDVQSKVDVEFQQIRKLVEERLTGETIYTLARSKPNDIVDYDSDGLTVVTDRGEGKVRWEWIRDVYDALYHLRQIEPKDVQEGEFQTPGGYRGTFIFALLARFAHIEARTDPRRLIYREPEGPIRLRDAGEDDDSSEPPPGPPASPTSGSPGAPGSRQPTTSRKLMSPSGRPDDMQTKTLFSHHYLQNRLPDHAEWQEDPRAVFEAVWELWQRARDYGDTWNESQTEQEFIQPMLELLGWAYIVQPKAHQAGQVRRPDYALFPDETVKDDAMPHQGDDAAFYKRAPAIAEAKYWGRPLSQKDPGGREKWDGQSNPSHQMVSYLVGTRVGWGILTNGLTWRLYSREVSSTASEYYEIDLGLILDSLPDDGEPTEGQLGRFRRWWLFFRQRSFVRDAEGQSFVERVHEGSDTYARRISDTLKKLVYEEVMPQIAGGFVAFRYDQKGVREETEGSLREVYRASLSLLYKLLFLLYGEARALLPVDNPSYREQSATALAQWAAGRIDKGLAISDATHATARYDALMALFHRVDRGDPSLGIPRYDGGLFDPSSPENQFLETHKLSDRAVARAVDTLVRDAGEPVDYAYIGVQNLGSIYEGLLENRLRVVDAAAGEVELIGDQGERKATGSYYTPDYIVEYIVRHTLDPILEERDEAFRSAMDRCAELRGQLKRVSDGTTARRLRGELGDAEREAREAFLGIKVLDPAMGSGHFLVNAVDHLTDAIIRRMQVYHDQHPDVSWDWNPIQRLIQQVRGAILVEIERQAIQLDPARLDDTALLTRLVMKRCIYGVDLNRMAVELAKVSLWLHTFTVGAPLSFLDHHLRWGNSLIGTDVRTVGEQIRKTGAGQLSLWQGPFAGLLDLTGLMVEVVERADATLADVEHSAETFKKFQKELTPYKQVLDLWVSQYFGNRLAKEFLTVQGDAVVPALKGKQSVPEEYEQAITEARRLYEEKRFFHWDLEFPEVFVDLRKRDWAKNPGFDAVIGNPPYGVSDSKGFLTELFPTTKGNWDVYVAFMERGVQLCRESGEVGYIVPVTWQTGAGYSDLRDYLLETSLTSVVNLPFDVFSDAYIDTGILVLRKHPPEATHEVRCCVFPKHIRVTDLENLKHSLIRQSLWSDKIILNLSALKLIERLESPTSSIELGAITHSVRGVLVSRDKDVSATDKGTEWRPYFTGDFGRYFIEKPTAFVRFGDNLAERPASPEVFSGSRLLIRRLVSRQDRLMATVATEGFVVKKDVYIFKTSDGAPGIHFLLSVINSRLVSFAYLGKDVAATKDDFRQTTLEGLRSLPIRRIAFTTPSDPRERFLADGIAEATEWIEATEGASVESVGFSAFSGSDLGRWLDERLSPAHTPDPELVRKHNADPLNEDWQLPEEGPVEQSDVVHDLLAHLAKRMIEMHEEKQSRVETFWLDLEGVAQPSTYEALHDHGKWESSLWKAEPCRDFVDEESRSTVHLDESLGWNEPCFKAFVKKLAGNISNLSDLVTVYRKHHRDCRQLMQRIAATDRLIDLIVYRLYGLTEEEVPVVEGESP